MPISQHPPRGKNSSQAPAGSPAGACGFGKTFFEWETISKKQGEFEGAKPASNQIECLQKACVSRRLRREAAAFRLAARVEKRGIVKTAGSPAGACGILPNGRHCSMNARMYCTRTSTVWGMPSRSLLTVRS